ncbi:MAG TPA: DUF881 domain-containing protein [Candidatus Limnocylindria bacterium]|nr:DUF881 domain-containing protein [Candidatus Limnocylindria bacterium]
MEARLRGDGRGTRAGPLSLALALVVIGFVGVVQWDSSAAREEFTTSAQQALARQVLALEREQAALREQIAEAEADVRREQDESEGSQAALEELNGRLEAARVAAGLTEVRGPGLIVEIADSKRVVPAGDNPANYIVLVDDLRDIVTALWASGAEAITINGERLVASSSIYGVGSSVLVNTAFLQPPFRIEAIARGETHDRFLAHPAFLGRAARRIDAYGLEFATAPDDELELPAFLGATRLRWAVPSGEAS